MLQVLRVALTAYVSSSAPGALARAPLEEALRRCLNEYPILRCVVVRSPTGEPCGYAINRDADANVPHHLHWHACPAADLDATTLALVQQRVQEPFESGSGMRPLAVDLVAASDGSRAALALTFHHAYADGVAACQLLASLCRHYRAAVRALPREPETAVDASSPPLEHLLDLRPALGQALGGERVGTWQGEGRMGKVNDSGGWAALRRAGGRPRPLALPEGHGVERRPACPGVRLAIPPLSAARAPGPAGAGARVQSPRRHGHRCAHGRSAVCGLRRCNAEHGPSRRGVPPR